MPKDFWPTYSAMANTHGGVVLLGVREKSGVFTVAGLPNAAKVRADLFNNLNNPGKVSVNLLTDADVQEVTINGAVHGEHTPLQGKIGDRIELMFMNPTMMMHPMHLHGHAFQVVNINGKAINGAMRDTVYVPPMAMVTVALDAGEAARWMLHCHHMPHLSTGMMTEFAVSA